MFKKILFLAISSLFAFGAIAQAGEIKASDSPFGYASIGAEQNFGRYADKESKEVVTKDRQELDKFISEISSGEFSSYASLRCLMPCKFSKS